MGSKICKERNGAMAPVVFAVSQIQQTTGESESQDMHFGRALYAAGKGLSHQRWRVGQFAVPMVSSPGLAAIESMNSLIRTREPGHVSIAELPTVSLIPRRARIKTERALTGFPLALCKDDL